MSAVVVTKIFKIEVNLKVSPFILLFDSKQESGELLFFKLEI